MSSVHASTLASLLMLAAIPCVPIYGWFSDKIGRRKPLMLIGLTLMTVALVSITYSSDVALVASVLALGISAATVPPM